MKKYLICLFVFLASCSSGKIEFYPSGGRLKNAKIGTFYQQGLVMRFQGVERLFLLFQVILEQN